MLESFNLDGFFVITKNYEAYFIYITYNKQKKVLDKLNYLSNSPTVKYSFLERD